MLLEWLLAVVLAGGWETHGPELPYVTQVAVSAVDDRRVYAIASDYPEIAAFRSDDAGQTWRRVFQAPPGQFLGTVFVDPTNPDRLFTYTYPIAPVLHFTTWLYRSLDGGETWTLQLTVDAIFCSVAFDALHADTIYAAFAGQEALFYRSEDGGDSFESGPAPPFVGLQDLQIAPDGSILAMPDGWQSHDGGETWQITISPPADCPITALAIDPVNPNRMFVTEGWNRSLCSQVLPSFDGGRTWFRGADVGGPAIDVVIDTSNPSFIYVSTGPNSVFPSRVLFSRADGYDWQDLGLPFVYGASDLALTGSGLRIYVATTSGVYTRSLRWTTSIPPKLRQTHSVPPRP